MKAAKSAAAQLLSALFVAGALVLSPCMAWGSGDSDVRTSPTIYRIRIEGSINPGISQFFMRALSTAQASGAACLVVELDTPGGLVSTLRDMIQAVMTSSVPVVVYVAPSGAQAASAGAILTLSAHVAAMAPGTNIGAAHPVGIGQKDEKDSVSGAKAENDIAAMARSIASERGKNATWAERAVRESVSATDREALELGVIDLVARDFDDLVQQLPSRITSLRPDTPFEVITLEPNLREQILSTIADPNIAYLLMMAGIAGLYFELAHPGAIFPGTVGAISLLLGLFALQALPVNTTGLLLILLSGLLLVLELFVTSYGILGISGTVALLLGSLMLFDTAETGIAVAMEVLIPTILAVGVFFALVIYLAGKAAIARPLSGSEGLIGETGTVHEPIGHKGGKVFVHGEIWNAVSEEFIEKGEEITVTGLKGLTLEVTTQKKGAKR